MVIDNENYFDVAEALYAWLSLNHEGQSSDKYSMLCQIDFRPSPLWSESRVEEENFYFAEIDEENYEEIFKALMLILEKSK